MRKLAMDVIGDMEVFDLVKKNERIQFDPMNETFTFKVNRI